MLFPAPTGAVSGELFEDDGLSHGWKEGKRLIIKWTVEYSVDFIDLTLSQSGEFRPEWSDLEVDLINEDARPLRINGERCKSFKLDANHNLG
jgi:alpha-glucosidase